jgi:hypothetical protein
MSIEIPLKAKYRDRPKGTFKSGHNDQGTSGGKKSRTESGAGLQIRTEARKVAQVQTADNQMMLFITPTGKRTWVRVKDMKK